MNMSDAMMEGKPRYKKTKREMSVLTISHSERERCEKVGDILVWGESVKVAS